MKVEIDFKKGERVYCLIDGRISKQTILGSARILVDCDCNVTSAMYDIDRNDPVYQSEKMAIPSDQIFRTKEEVFKALGLD